MDRVFPRGGLKFQSEEEKDFLIGIHTSDVFDCAHDTGEVEFGFGKIATCNLAKHANRVEFDLGRSAHKRTLRKYV